MFQDVKSAAFVRWMDSMRDCVDSIFDLQTKWKNGHVKLDPLPVKTHDVEAALRELEENLGVFHLFLSIV